MSERNGEIDNQRYWTSIRDNHGLNMRLMQRVAISGLLSIMLIVLLTGAFVTRRDLSTVVESGVAPAEHLPAQINPDWVQENAIPDQDQDLQRIEEIGDVDVIPGPSAVGPAPAPDNGVYVIRPPNPPLDDVTNQRREKVKEVRDRLFFIIVAKDNVQPFFFLLFVVGFVALGVRMGSPFVQAFIQEC